MDEAIYERTKGRVVGRPGMSDDYHDSHPLGKGSAV